VATDDWFWGWVERHCERFPRHDWPGLDSEYWRELRHLLITRGATEAVADEASRRLFAQPPGYPEAHPRALGEMIREVFRDRAPGSMPVRPDDAAFDRAAEANWESLSEAERDVWRTLVRERLPELAHSSWWLEGLARAWAHDPSSVVDFPPPPEGPGAKRGPRRLTFKPKGS
jgi:hypothetical protein